MLKFTPLFPLDSFSKICAIGASKISLLPVPIEYILVQRVLRPAEAVVYVKIHMATMLKRVLAYRKDRKGNWAESRKFIVRRVTAAAARVQINPESVVPVKE